MGRRPRIAITLGDVAGIGPELLVKAWRDPLLWAICRPIVLGNAAVLRRAARELAGGTEALKVRPGDGPASDGDPAYLPCVDPSATPVSELEPGRVHPEAGRAAYDWLVQAIDWAQAGQIDAIVTLPINKEGLRAAGLAYPGHTEILAERTATKNFAMMLYRQGLGVLHATLHMALRQVFEHLSTAGIHERIVLLDAMMRRLGVAAPRLAVAALNPHAGEHGLFGDEEGRIIEPAIGLARSRGIDVAGPLPADTLFAAAAAGRYDGVVAMYHDQGHIALKVLGWRQAVNITVGLPIVRTSVAHGTAYDIAGQGLADPASLLEAVRVAAMLWQND